MKDTIDAAAWADMILRRRRTFCIQSVANWTLEPKVEVKDADQERDTEVTETQEA